MNLSLKDTLNTLLAKMDQMDQRLQENKDQAEANCKYLATRLDMVKTNQRKTPYHEGNNESRDNNRSPRIGKLNHTPLRTQMPSISKV